VCWYKRIPKARAAAAGAGASRARAQATTGASAAATGGSAAEPQEGQSLPPILSRGGRLPELSLPAAVLSPVVLERAHGIPAGVRKRSGDAVPEQDGEPASAADLSAEGSCAEFPFAWIKDKFRMRKFRSFGMVKARTEAVWACLAHNAMIWQRLVWSSTIAQAA
jgi:hypothetical protein